MGPKILWVLLPLGVYAALLALAWRGRAPSRLAVNMHSSLLLMAYLLATAGLGLFWVANQQLPVFDWHYLFGYTTLLLLCLHLFFNLPLVLRWFGQPAHSPAPPGASRWRGIVRLAAGAGMVVLAFMLGTHWAGPSGAPAKLASDTTALATVVQYHEYSSESRRGVFRRAPAVAWGDPPAPFKSYPGAATVALPRAGPLAAPDGRGLSAVLQAPAAPRDRPLDLAAIGQMLHLSAGVTARRGGLALRATPSSGALFPGELYLRVRRVEGLQPGLYHFDPDLHRLQRLGDLPAPSGWLALEQADAALVLAAVFHRTGYKYRNRAYRYVAADLGHLLENARLAAHYVGASARVIERFDEALLAREFGLDGLQEGVIAVAAFNASSGTAMPGAGRQAKQDGDLGVTGSVHRATSLAPPLPLPAPGSLPDTGTAAGALVALPAPAPAQADLAATILQRRSQRRFSARPVPLRELSSMLADMFQPALLSPALHADLVVNRVEGLAAGVYRYLPAQHALQPVQLGDFAQQAQNAALDQDVIGDASVVLLLSADRNLALQHGARGYRMAFLEAGMMGERWLLSAVARGFGACPVGAFFDDEAAALVKAPAERWVLHFAALGYAAD